MRTSYRAAILSFIMPGLGQIYAGERPKGLAILCMTAGIVFGICWSSFGPEAFRSFLAPILLAILYPFVWIPAIIDAYQTATGSPKPILSGKRPWYVIFMLLGVGPMAIPLLWQNPAFSKPAKIIWTIIVILVALFGIFIVVVVAPSLEKLLQNAPGLLRGYP